jgi:hypothetical protein
VYQEWLTTFEQWRAEWDIDVIRDELGPMPETDASGQRIDPDMTSWGLTICVTVYFDTMAKGAGSTCRWHMSHGGIAYTAESVLDESGTGWKAVEKRPDGKAPTTWEQLRAWRRAAIDRVRDEWSKGELNRMIVYTA